MGCTRHATTQRECGHVHHSRHRTKARCRNAAPHLVLRPADILLSRAGLHCGSSPLLFQSLCPDRKASSSLQSRQNQTSRSLFIASTGNLIGPQKPFYTCPTSKPQPHLLQNQSPGRTCEHPSNCVCGPRWLTWSHAAWLASSRLRVKRRPQSCNTLIIRELLKGGGRSDHVCNLGALWGSGRY